MRDVVLVLLVGSALFGCGDAQMRKSRVDQDAAVVEDDAALRDEDGSVGVVVPNPNPPALLASYIVSPNQQFAEGRYTPRGVTQAPYRGWDLLVLPGHRGANDGVNTIMSNADWLTLRLNRAATLAVVWRGSLAPPMWLADGWTKSDDVMLEDGTYATYRRSFDAGTVTLGAVNNPGVSTSQATYYVLLAEENGSPSEAPMVPTGRETPRVNETCPAWVHDQYVAEGPDGRTYPTWHPQIDPVYWCYFRHEHGSDPTLFSATHPALFGYTQAEAHEGYKNYVFELGGYRWLFTQHMGTATVTDACVRYHTTDVAVLDVSSDELVADLHLSADYGYAATHGNRTPLTPTACPDQANIDESNGLRLLPVEGVPDADAHVWRPDTNDTILGFNARSMLFVTYHFVAACNALVCDNAVSAGDNGIDRFMKVFEGTSLIAGEHTGTFYTDAQGKVLMNEGDAGALRQYVKPGVNIVTPDCGSDPPILRPIEPWRMGFECTDHALMDSNASLEGSVLAFPNLN